jgi:hypothetical protein
MRKSDGIILHRLHHKIGNIMIKLWRSIMMGLAGFMCPADTCRYNHQTNCKCGTEGPEEIIAPLGFMFVGSIIMIFIVNAIIELPITWLINEKILKKECGNRILSEKFFDKIEKYIEKFLNKRGIKLNEIDPKKIYMVCKLPPDEREEYIYYKYCVKFFKFSRRKGMIEEDREMLNELIKLRDEKHEHYLILKLGKIK